MQTWATPPELHVLSRWKHFGHLLPFVREEMAAVHWKGWLCSWQTHCTRLLDSSRTSEGVRPSLPAGSHCSARSGLLTASELQAQGTFLEHTGQPEAMLPALFCTLACQTCGCPQGHALHSQ